MTAEELMKKVWEAFNASAPQGQYELFNEHILFKRLKELETKLKEEQ